MHINQDHTLLFQCWYSVGNSLLSYYNLLLFDLVTLNNKLLEHTTQDSSQPEEVSLPLEVFALFIKKKKKNRPTLTVAALSSHRRWFFSRSRYFSCFRQFGCAVLAGTISHILCCFFTWKWGCLSYWKLFRRVRHSTSTAWFHRKQ